MNINIQNNIICISIYLRINTNFNVYNLIKNTNLAYVLLNILSFGKVLSHLCTESFSFLFF